MTNTDREDRLIHLFVSMADTLVDDFDVIELMQTLVEESIGLFDAVAGGILLTSGDSLVVAASSNESTELLSTLQLREGDGPCLLSVSTGEETCVEDTATETRWPEFAAQAEASGYRSVHSIPMKLRDNVIGSFNLFRGEPGRLNARDARAARALSDVATIGILQERVAHEADITRSQLQRALDSRVVIEQAKGFLASTQSVDPDAAFQRIRNHARATGTRLADVAADVVSGAVRLP